MRDISFNKYIGLPFEDRGRSMMGCDCWGLVCEVYRLEFEIQLPSLDDRYTSVTDFDNMNDTVDMEKENWEEIPKGQELLGDVIILRVMGLPIHVGIVNGRGKMLHILKGMNAVLENYRGRAWEKRVIGFARHKEMIDA